MKYYEIWFYYYGSDDARNNDYKEFTFYCKVDHIINTKEEMIQHLKNEFPVCQEFKCDQINCIADEHYNNLSKWFEISAEEFEDGCGIVA